MNPSAKTKVSATESRPTETPVTRSIRVKAIDHVTIVVSDLERSRSFYCDLLGMREIERPGFQFPGLWFEADGTQVHLILEFDGSATPGYANETEKTMKGVLHHFAFEVDDAAKAAETLRNHGVRINGGPVPRPDGPTQVWFYDPDGHVIEVFDRRCSARG